MNELQGGILVACAIMLTINSFQILYNLQQIRKAIPPTVGGASRQGERS